MFVRQQDSGQNSKTRQHIILSILLSTCLATPLLAFLLKRSYDRQESGHDKTRHKTVQHSDSDY